MRRAFVTLMVLLVLMAVLVLSCDQAAPPSPTLPTPYEKYSLTNPVTYKISFVDTLQNPGPGVLGTADTYLIVPHDVVGQKVTDFQLSPTPNDYLADEWGQNIAHYSWKNVGPNTQLQVTWTLTLQSWDVRYNIIANQPASLDQTPPDIRTTYTRDEAMYDISNPQVQAKAKELAGPTVYQTLWNIYKFLATDFKYTLTDKWQAAPGVLASGQASCSEFTFLFSALARANGIPTRFVGGTRHRGALGQYHDTAFHRRPEVYYPGYGWAALDPTRSAEENTDRYFFFTPAGSLTIAEAGGEVKYTHWNYHAYNSWAIAHGTTQVQVSRYADWQRPQAFLSDPVQPFQDRR